MSVFLSPWSMYVKICCFTDRRAKASRRGERVWSPCLGLDGVWVEDSVMELTPASLVLFLVRFEIVVFGILSPERDISSFDVWSLTEPLELSLELEGTSALLSSRYGQCSGPDVSCIVA